MTTILLIEKFTDRPVDWDKLEEALIRADLGVPMMTRIMTPMQKIILKSAVLMAAMLCAPLAANASLLTFRAALDSAQVIDGGPSVSTATGLAIVTLDTELFTLTTDYSWAGLTGPGDRAHLHNGLRGEARDPVILGFRHQVLFLNTVDEQYLTNCGYIPGGLLGGRCVTLAGEAHDVLQLAANNGYNFDDKWTFQDLVDAFENGEIYIDMHTEAYPADEIRGQFAAAVPEPSTYAMLALGAAGLGAHFVRRRRRR